MQGSCQNDLLQEAGFQDQVQPSSILIYRKGFKFNLKARLRSGMTIASPQFKIVSQTLQRKMAETFVSFLTRFRWF